MSLFGPHYYKVTRDVRILQWDGSSLSNTWIGSSRAIDTVYLAVNAHDGDEIHDLPGGLFHVSAGTKSSRKISHVPPKHIFETSYGGDPNKSRLETLIKGGCLKEVEAPEFALDHREARDQGEKRHADLKGGVRHVDQDPLEVDADELADAMSEAGVDFDVRTLKFMSETAYDPAQMTFKCQSVPDIDWRIVLREDGWTRLIRSPSVEGRPRMVDGNLNRETFSDVAERFAEMVRDAAAEAAPSSKM